MKANYSPRVWSYDVIGSFLDKEFPVHVSISGFDNENQALWHLDNHKKRLEAKLSYYASRVANLNDNDQQLHVSVDFKVDEIRLNGYKEVARMEPIVKGDAHIYVSQKNNIIRFIKQRVTLGELTSLVLKLLK